jgi:zinc transporter ZupT
MTSLLYLFISEPTINSPLPVERIDIERIVLRSHEIVVYTVNSSPTDVEIAQVLVNDAIWGGIIEPSNAIPRLGKATLTIPYQWVEGEPLIITIITSNGFKFEREIEAAFLTPEISLALVNTFILLGAFVGLIPVFLGISWLPFLRSLNQSWYDFLLSFTVGLLIFLGIDSIEGGLEASSRVPIGFNGVSLIIVGLSASLLILLGFSRSSMISKGNQAPHGITLAYMISLGIGLHNLGEGLAIGSAYAIGEIALGVFLVLGFTIHNLTEGIAIVAPLSKRISIKHLGSLGLLAGGPTILGTIIGGFSFSDFWAAFFLAVGAGAIFQVVYEIFRYMSQSRNLSSTLGQLRNSSGIVAGIVFMYLTGLLVAT